MIPLNFDFTDLIFLNHFQVCESKINKIKKLTREVLKNSPHAKYSLVKIIRVNMAVSNKIMEAN